MVSRILSTVAVLGLATSGTAKVKLETVNPSPAKNTIKLPMTVELFPSSDGQPMPPTPSCCDIASFPVMQPDGGSDGWPPWPTLPPLAVANEGTTENTDGEPPWPILLPW